METIVEYEKKNNLQRLIEEYDTLLLWYTLIKETQFVEIYQVFWAEKSRKLPRSKLTEMLGGPYLPWEEDPKDQNIHSRNTLFELEIAAKLKQAGTEITNFDDIDFAFREKTFNVQCKRVHSAKMIGADVEKAADQFSKRMRLKSKLKGIICFSIDKLTGKEHKILKVKNVQQIQPGMAELTTNFIKVYHRLWHNFLNINILAIYVFLQAVATIDEEPPGLLTTCQQLDYRYYFSPRLFATC
ncbi:MAG: hypothetical protein JRI58_13075 [Deltaproteobacteria bacterium]|nr:hypothetical protein [Deltaproteobacteria bacterium]MBW2075655.1 hypothetical protein [Deltaproteobacteria bacterium]